jgi:hypothetical protein
MARWGAAGASLQDLKRKTGFLGILETGLPMAEGPPAVPVIAPVLVARGWETLRLASWGLFGRGSGRYCKDALIESAIDQGGEVICSDRDRYPMQKSGQNTVLRQAAKP